MPFGSLFPSGRKRRAEGATAPRRHWLPERVGHNALITSRRTNSLRIRPSVKAFCDQDILLAEFEFLHGIFETEYLQPDAGSLTSKSVSYGHTKQPEHKLSDHSIVCR